MQNSKENKANEEYTKLLSEYKKINQKSNEIQSRYSFEIPDYLLSEIAKIDDMSNGINEIQLLINLSVISNRITDKQAEILRKDLVK